MDLIFLLLLSVNIISSIILVIYPVNLFYLALKSIHWQNPKIKTSYEKSQFPTVTIQIPVYNESLVIKECLESIANLNYPRLNLSVQILDDSTDGTSDLIDLIIPKLKASDLNVEVIRRSERIGYKAGALANGLKVVSSDLVAIFDADFRVDPQFLINTIHYFNNREIGAVQTRWTHSNLNYSLFTKAMSIGIDGHFLIEKIGRLQTNSFITFNGTGGIWRKSVIDECGGWSARTLAEDLDLAYRAQLKGYKLLYLSKVTNDQEIPPTLRSWIVQQSRWSQGFSQNLRLHIISILNSNHGKSKLQALLHLTAYFVPFLLLLNVGTTAILLYYDEYNPQTFILLGLLLFFAYFLGILAYIVAIKRAERPKKHIILVPIFLWLGSSLIVRMTYGTIKGLFFKGGSFEKTPKFNVKEKNANVKLHKLKISLDRILFLEISFLIILIIGIIGAILKGWQTIIYVITFSFFAFSLLLLIFSEIKHAIQ